MRTGCKRESRRELRVCGFGAGWAEGGADLADVLGGKGANLAEMCRLGLPVPPGFTIRADACGSPLGHGDTWPDGLDAEIRDALTRLEAETGLRFGDPERPLLLSVRSGAAVSMPGMMDTVLNLGLNAQTVQGLARLFGDARFAQDCRQRFLRMYGSVVLGVPVYLFEDALDAVKRAHRCVCADDLTPEGWHEVVAAYQALVQTETGQPFPEDPQAQLRGAIAAVCRSWNSSRAQTYRRLHAIPEDGGTAVTVQAMVFGNLGQDGATGVVFTRDPATGANGIYGEYLSSAQGEDVVAGGRTPLPIREMRRLLPEAFGQLERAGRALERHFGDVQDIEFTVQRGKLFLLQTRVGKRTSAAALKIACDLAREGVITQAEAVRRIPPESLAHLLHPMLDPDAPRTVLAQGLPASPGAVSGRLVFSAQEAEVRARLGERVILCRTETSPEDIAGMHAAAGILTTRGGLTSHAAVIARGMGRPCVCGAGSLRVDPEGGVLQAGDHVLKAGDDITLDGSTGLVMTGIVPVREPDLSDDFCTLMAWADEGRMLGVRANADTPQDARVARLLGAEGIGLCRTEHMFFEAKRLAAIRRVILAGDEAGRQAALAQLEPLQTEDFTALFREMEDLPVCVRLLDPPLLAFLPKKQSDIEELAGEIGISEAVLQHRIQGLRETNPMLGHRGCRLGVTFPGIYDMQLRALFAAAQRVPVQLEILLPLVMTQAELAWLGERVRQVAEVCQARPYKLGIMIELPRAALCAADLAPGVDFFSFGTNDLTQTTLGISRDDAHAFLPTYLRQGLLQDDPFVTLDEAGVGTLIQLAATHGRRANPALMLGICGEHGGDPASVGFFTSTGMDYVSCSPYRLPVARLAAAQAGLTPTPQGSPCALPSGRSFRGDDLPE